MVSNEENIKIPRGIFKKLCVNIFIQALKAFDLKELLELRFNEKYKGMCTKVLSENF